MGSSILLVAHSIGIVIFLKPTYELRVWLACSFICALDFFAFICDIVLAEGGVFSFLMKMSKPFLLFFIFLKKKSNEITFRKKLGILEPRHFQTRRLIFACGAAPQPLPIPLLSIFIF
jgi:hypothetical protein